MDWPKGFMWGTGASSTQCEGAAPASDWIDWERVGNAPRSGDGNGFAERYSHDFRSYAALGLRHHRLSIEWARIEPAEGERDAAAVAHYRAVLESAHASGVVPWVCLHHFTLPRWFADKGGFLVERNRTEAWARHVDFMAETFADLAGGWKPVNEVERDDRGQTEDRRNWRASGRRHRREPVERPDVASAFDLIGFSYYNAMGVADGCIVNHPADAPRSPLGYAIWADGVGIVLDRLHAELPGTPLLVDEFGIGTDDGGERAAYLRRGLDVVHDAIQRGIDVRGFFHWTGVDNYEWLHGYDVALGLIGRDRHVRPSARVLADEAMVGHD